jgi:hypothetical protein
MAGNMNLLNRFHEDIKIFLNRSVYELGEEKEGKILLYNISNEGSEEFIFLPELSSQLSFLDKEIYIYRQVTSNADGEIRKESFYAVYPRTSFDSIELHFSFYDNMFYFSSYIINRNKYAIGQVVEPEDIKKMLNVKEAFFHSILKLKEFRLLHLSGVIKVIND